MPHLVGPPRSTGSLVYVSQPSAFRMSVMMSSIVVIVGATGFQVSGVNVALCLYDSQFTLCNSKKNLMEDKYTASMFQGYCYLACRVSNDQPRVDSCF